MYNPTKHGKASRDKFVQLSASEISGIVEGPNSDSYLPGTRYAQLTYQVNATPIQISGDVIVDAVGIDGSGTVGVTTSGDLQVHDASVVEAVNNITVPSPIVTNYSTLIRVSGAFTYIMKSAISAGTSGDANWQIKRVEADGSNNDISWADGNDNFDNIAANYATITYSI